MRRRLLLIPAALTVLIIAAWAARTPQEKRSQTPDLARAMKAKFEQPPAAVLIEMGLKDTKATDWSGKAIVKGAKVVRRKSYRFRTDGKNDDKLIEPNAWQAKSHFSIRAPRNPIVRRMEPIATVGVILYVEKVKGDATATVQTNDPNTPAAKVDLNKVLAGEPVSIFGGYAVVRRISTATPVAVGDTEDDYPAAAYGPDGTLWVAYISYTLRDKTRRIEQQAYRQQPANFDDLNHPGYADQLFVKAFRGGKWTKPIAVTDNRQDIARCALAVTNDNVVWIIYSANRGNNFDLYARPLKGGNFTPRKEIRLTNSPGPDLTPAAGADSEGNVWVAWQSWSSERPARISVVKQTGGGWSKPKVIEAWKDDGNYWHPVIAAGPKGEVALAYDVFRFGDYDVDVRFLTGNEKTHKIARARHFQARPSLTFDSKGGLWIAYEHGPEKWGKDYGAQDSKDGNPLYNARTVKVKRLVKGLKKGGTTLYATSAGLPEFDVSVPQLPFSAIKTNKFEKRTRFAYPKIGLDGNGRVWLTYRKNFGSRYTSHPGATWRTYARRLDDTNGTTELEIHHSDGLLDSRPAMLPHKSGGLVIIHNTDGRFTTPNTINNKIYLSVVDLNREYKSPSLLVELGRGTKMPQDIEEEYAGVKRIRNYRIKTAGKELRLLRGEYHRHTEISWDGAPDGSLEDMFRYAIDAAAFDWIGNGDHDNGAGREYPWWLTQKYTDAYHVAGKFTPMFTYERSVSYPHGHRNVMFAKRGIMTLPRLAPPKDGKKYPGRVHPDDTKMLYRYLKQFDGICAVHTSATGMGTDWRDNDPKVEPIVEIYQGDRMSYEAEGAPRAGYDPKKDKLPANVGGWRPFGFVDNALRNKGYKLAFQASSDHWSTHISYFIVLAEKNDRASILDAVKKRHCYGATDNIILDVRSGEHIQGDEIKTNNAPTLQFTVIGTTNLAKVDIIKNSRAVKSYFPKKQKYAGEWTEPNPGAGTNYYYVRVVQSDGEVAWGSPIWFVRK